MIVKIENKHPLNKWDIAECVYFLLFYAKSIFVVLTVMYRNIIHKKYKNWWTLSRQQTAAAVALCPRLCVCVFPRGRQDPADDDTDPCQHWSQANPAQAWLSCNPQPGNNFRILGNFMPRRDLLMIKHGYYGVLNLMSVDSTESRDVNSLYLRLRPRESLHLRARKLGN